MTRRKLAALPIIALLAAAPTAAAQDTAPKPPRVTETFRTFQSWTLKPNAKQTFSVRINGLTATSDTAILNHCWGFEITGPGINLPIGEPEYYGVTTPEHGMEDTENGGVPGAERQPDGTFVVPESNAVVSPFHLKRGLACQKVGWSVPWGSASELLQAAPTAARYRRTARRAQSGAVRVELAGLHLLADGAELELRVQTGDVPAGTKVKARALASRIER